LVKIVFINNRRGVRKTLRLQGWAKVAASLCLLGLPLSAGLFLGIQMGGGKVGILLEQSLDNLQEDLISQRQQLEESKRLADQQVEALSVKLAEMQARLVRLDALGERLTAMADLEDGEFDFSRQSPVGGPGTSVGAPEFAPPQVDLHLLFNELEAQIDSRESQLDVLESLLVNRQFNEDSSIAGKPVEKGWISSRYGMRTDPFNGRKSWHNGVDFAGRSGANVVSVGSGVVTWSGPYQGYGNMVEIDHGEGFVTRYAHNQENSVKVGDLVQRGQVIAAIGSTGRATGPHLHFEVYKNGRSLDPSLYIRKTLR
jgi:murein DD-endopeptidase MepM/ murein hydrolase activator NlpD